MSAAFKQVVENIKELSPGERVPWVAHCLILSPANREDENVDEAWVSLTEKRYLELVSGVVKGVSWEYIKNEVKNQDA